MTYSRKYCTECNWSVSTENHSKDETFSLVMEHFDETRHTIESEPVAELDKIEIY